MKIALITDGIAPYVLGGMQRHSYYLAKYLAQNEVQVDLFHFNQSQLDIQALDCFSSEEKKYINSIIIPFPTTIKFPGHYIYESYLYSKEIYKRIKSTIDQYDFIYTKGFSGWKLICIKSKDFKLPPIGINVHGYEMFQKAPAFKTVPSLFLLRLFVKPLLVKSDLVFSYGGKVTSLLTEEVRISRNRIIEVPGGIESSWLNSTQKSTSNKVRFVFMGRAERRKGIEELNEVLRILEKKSEFTFTFIGPIPEHLKVDSPKITYLGEIRDINRIKQILFENDVLVCPSHSEGMPNVILEAMANQLAIIATDVGAVSMMVSNDNGVLIGNLTVPKLEKAIEDMCQLNGDQLKALQLNSLQKVKNNFLWDEIIKSLLSKIKNQLASPDLIGE